jgi:hypothetical protein
MMDQPPLTPRIDPLARRRIFRKLAALLLASVALLIVTLYHRDGTRMTQARDWARHYVQAVSSVPVLDGALPLNLAPPTSTETGLDMGTITWIDREQALILRSHDGPLMVAQTNPVPLMLRTSGRVVVFFEAGDWRTEWVSLAEFDRLERQRAGLIESRSGAPAPPPDQPAG